MRYVAFALAAMLATASMAKADPTYEEVTAWALKHNKTITVSVGYSDQTADIRCDWYANSGYAKGLYVFAPNGRGWFIDVTPANNIYFNPQAKQSAASGCSTGSCSTSSSPVRLRLFQGVQTGNCASGQCGR